MANYCCVQIDAPANKNIVPLLFKELTGNIPINTKCKIQFIGFKGEEGLSFKINGVPNQIPSNGYFITPYEGQNYISIHSVSFDETQNGIKIWFIY